MEFGALVGNPSHYGDAQSCSNVPAKRSGPVDDPVVVLTPLEVLAVATETETEDGGARVRPFLLAPTSLPSHRARGKNPPEFPPPRW